MVPIVWMRRTIPLVFYIKITISSTQHNFPHQINPTLPTSVQHTWQWQYFSTQLDTRPPKMIQLSLSYVISSECNINHNQTRELASTTTPLCRHSNITWGALTKHLGDIWFDVDVLEVLVGVSMVEAKGWVESDAHPHPIPNPSHLAHLRLFARVCIKCFLYGRVQRELIDIESDNRHVGEDTMLFFADCKAFWLVRPTLMKQSLLMENVILRVWGSTSAAIATYLMFNASNTFSLTCGLFCFIIKYQCSLTLSHLKC